MKTYVHELRKSNIFTDVEQKIAMERTNIMEFVQTKYYTGSGIKQKYTLDEAIDILSFCNERNLMLIWVHKNENYLRAKVRHFKQDKTYTYEYLYKNIKKENVWKYSDRIDK